MTRVGAWWNFSMVFYPDVCSFQLQRASAQDRNNENELTYITVLFVVQTSDRFLSYSLTTQDTGAYLGAQSYFCAVYMCFTWYKLEHNYA